MVARRARTVRAPRPADLGGHVVLKRGEVSGPLATTLHFPRGAAGARPRRRGPSAHVVMRWRDLTTAGAMRGGLLVGCYGSTVVGPSQRCGLEAWLKHAGNALATEPLLGGVTASARVIILSRVLDPVLGAPLGGTTLSPSRSLMYHGVDGVAEGCEVCAGIVAAPPDYNLAPGWHAKASGRRASLYERVRAREAAAARPTALG